MHVSFQREVVLLQQFCEEFGPGRHFEVRVEVALWLPRLCQEPEVRQHIEIGSEGFRVLWHGSHVSPLGLHCES